MFTGIKKQRSNRVVKHVGKIDIPSGQETKERKSKYSFDKLAAGESIEVRYSRRNQINILTAAKMWAKRKKNNATFVTKKVDDRLYLTRTV